MATNTSVVRSRRPEETSTYCANVALQEILSTVWLFTNTKIALNHERNIFGKYVVKMNKTLKHKDIHDVINTNFYQASALKCASNLR